jgi:hypothetical protein
MVDRTGAHYELARALIRFEDGDVEAALREARSAAQAVRGAGRLEARVHTLVTALEREAAGSSPPTSVARAYRDAVDELRHAD